jgi:uncharacterized protein
VVIDTNVFVSAVLKPRSNTGRILELVCYNDLELNVYPDIPSEIKRVLHHPELVRMHGLSPDRRAAWLENIEVFSKVVNPGMRLNGGSCCSRDDFCNQSLIVAIETVIIGACSENPVDIRS